MLSFDVRTLESTAATVDGSLSAEDPIWEEGDPRPTDAVRVTGRLSTAGPGRYYFSGRIEGSVRDSCRRCLTDVESMVSAEAHLFFAEADAALEGELDDPDVFEVDPTASSIDLRPAIREEWLLDVPAFALCREDCKGLCPTCGADLNSEACECAPRADTRWDALRNLGSDPS
jgi:uncharacterized protein